MALPAAIRINTNAPFPALVTGGTGIGINKQNGIWTVSFNINTFGTQIPPPANYANDYILVYDAVANTYFKMPLNSLSLGLSSRLQRSVTTTPIVITNIDQQLNCKITTPATCALPPAASRVGAPLTFKDLGQATANNITITPNGAELIDGQASVKIINNYAQLTLVPFNDGVNAGWMMS